MFCTHCGSEVDAGAKFCTNCGAPIEKDLISQKEEDLDSYVQEGSGSSEEVFEETFEEGPRPEAPHGQSHGSQLSAMMMVGEWNDMYLWLLGLLPILNLLHLGSFILFVLGVVLVVLDYRELQSRNGVKLATWVVVIGALFNIVYLIARPNSTSKNYKPLIVFIIIAFAVSAFRL